MTTDRIYCNCGCGANLPNDGRDETGRPITRQPAIFTCGNCQLSWDDNIITSLTPTPSGRCPFEYFHEYTELENGDTYCRPLSAWEIPPTHPVRPHLEATKTCPCCKQPQPPHNATPYCDPCNTDTCGWNH